MSNELRQARILIADDSATVRHQLHSIISLEGVSEIMTASDGVEAVELAKGQQFDLVVIDIDMPRLNGIEAVRRIRDETSHKNTPIFALTARTDSKLVQQGKEVGMTGWLVKPFRNQTMLTALKQALKASRQKQSNQAA